MKNEKGITLLEVIAVISLAAIVSTIAFNLLTTSYKEGDLQNKENREIQTTSYALKLFTKDIRQSIGTINITNNEFTLKNGVSASNNVYYKYNPSTQTLLRNNQQIALNIEFFEVTHSPSAITIKLKNSKNETVETTLFYRKE